MKKLIVLMWIAVSLIIGVVFFQNQALFFSGQALNLKLLSYNVTFPLLYNGTIMLFFFFSGALLVAASSLISRFKAHRVLKKCKATAEGYLDKIGELRANIDGRKSNRALKDLVIKPSEKYMQPV